MKSIPVVPPPVVVGKDTNKKIPSLQNGGLNFVCGPAGVIQGSKNEKNREIESQQQSKVIPNRCVQSYSRSSVYTGRIPTDSSLCEPRAAPSAPCAWLRHEFWAQLALRAKSGAFGAPSYRTGNQIINTGTGTGIQIINTG